MSFPGGQREGSHHDQVVRPARPQRAVRPHLHPHGPRYTRGAGGRSSPASTTGSTPRSSSGSSSATLPSSATPEAVLPRPSSTTSPTWPSSPTSCSARKATTATLFEVAVIHHTQCGAGFLADPSFRHQVAEATGLSEPVLEASAVADPHATVREDVERLLAETSLPPKVSVSGHVYDIATGHVTTIVDAR